MLAHRQLSLILLPMYRTIPSITRKKLRCQADASMVSSMPLLATPRCHPVSTHTFDCSRLSLVRQNSQSAVRVFLSWRGTWPAMAYLPDLPLHKSHRCDTCTTNVATSLGWRFPSYFLLAQRLACRLKYDYFLWEHPTHPCRVFLLQQTIRRPRFQSAFPT